MPVLALCAIGPAAWAADADLPGAAPFQPPEPVRIGEATIGGKDTTYSVIGGVVFSSDGSTVHMIGDIPFVAGRNGPVACDRIANRVSCMTGR